MYLRKKTRQNLIILSLALVFLWATVSIVSVEALDNILFEKVYAQPNPDDDEKNVDVWCTFWTKKVICEVGTIDCTPKVCGGGIQ
jgi:hypothetical protein